MSIFVAVVDLGSLSAAARRLDLPLATVSRKVGQLESHLKVRLLHRTRRQLSLKLRAFLHYVTPRLRARSLDHHTDVPAT